MVESLTTTDVLAIIGAVTGIIGTMAGLAALSWDFYKWQHSERPRLGVTVLPNMMMTGYPKHKPVIMVKVTNVGKLTTTLTHLALESKNKSERKHNALMIMDTGLQQLPFVLQPSD